MELAATSCHIPLQPRGKGVFYRQLAVSVKEALRVISVDAITKFIDREIEARDQEIRDGEKDSGKDPRRVSYFTHLDTVRERLVS
jgi:hypothetical protein